MPLPLPNLDTRRWADLTDEGRALIPRFSSAWTDHNVSDPGVTLIELFAYFTEEQLYRANRIPDRHYRKLLALLGFAPRSPRPALAVLGATLPAAAVATVLARGALLVADAGAGSRLLFQTIDEVTLVGAQLVTVQQHADARYHDRTRAVRERVALRAFGSDPRVPVPYDAAKAPALYLGFDHALPKNVPARLHFRFAGAMRDERERLLAEAVERAEACARVPVTCTPRCPPTDDEWCADASGAPAAPAAPSVPTSPASTPSLPPHHSARTVWEYLAADGWHLLDPTAGDVDDQTRSFTLDGIVRVTVPGDMAPTALGAVAAPRFYLRCRLAAGAYDAAPALIDLTMNAILTEQAAPAIERFTIAAGVVPTGPIVPGARTKLAMRMDSSGVVHHLQAGVTDPRAPDLLVVAYLAPTAIAEGAVTLAVSRVGTGTGLPDQSAILSDAPVSRGTLSLWTLEPGAGAGAAQRWVAWEQRRDLDAAGPMDRRTWLDATRGELHFGTGVRGRMPADATPILVAFDSTAAEAGNLAASRTWRLADAALNVSLLGPSLATLAATTFTNGSAAEGGADEEDIGAAASRAASALWAHERLVRLCPSGECSTLDQLDRHTVLDLPAPDRATTLLDFERIALEIPGTRVRRARAWANVDPSYPCLEASGTVTVVIVPELPAGRPTPSAGLLRAVRRWLDRRRVLCTRLVVVGPQYLPVDVTARIRAYVGADPTRVQADVADALTTFLDPLRGGPAGRGWPFGRDVYRSEILQVIDQVRGVDHVLQLTITTDGRDVACGNLCVPSTWLVTAGTMTIEVTRT